MSNKYYGIIQHLANYHYNGSIHGKEAYIRQLTLGIEHDLIQVSAHPALYKAIILQHNKAHKQMINKEYDNQWKEYHVHEQEWSI
jgi:hypothetical protein